MHLFSSIKWNNYINLNKIYVEKLICDYLWPSSSHLNVTKIESSPYFKINIIPYYIIYKISLHLHVHRTRLQSSSLSPFLFKSSFKTKDTKTHLIVLVKGGSPVSIKVSKTYKSLPSCIMQG